MKRLIPIALLLLTQAAAAQAPSGFKTWVDKESGVTGYLPKAYKAIPLPPTEAVIRVKMVQRSTPTEIMRMFRRDWFPSLYVFTYVSGSGGTTPGKSGEAEEANAGPTSIKELMQKRNAVASFTQLKSKKLRRWKNVDPVKGEKGLYRLSRENIDSARKRDRAGLDEGWLFLKEEGSVRFGAWIETKHAHAGAARKLLKKIGRSLKMPKGRTAVRAAEQIERELDRIYRFKKLRGVPHRRTVRKNLAPGWKAVDSENYIIVHHVKNTALIKRIAKDIEAMREFYMTLFPPARDVDAVSIVRVCRNKEEYHRYGGRPGTGGFWHSGNEELVFYDYLQTTLDASRTGAKMKRRTTTKDSLLVLYHEAFHQYIYYAVGEVAPHDWFNEGNGDYFSGALVSTAGKVTKIRPSSWRIHRAKDQMEYGKGRIKLDKLLTATRRLYYGPRVADFYAAGWSFVYFLRTCPEVKKHEQWSKLIDTYFNALKHGYAAALESAGSKPSLADKQRAQASAKGVAIKAMMKGLDVNALDAAWEAYIKKLRDPWPDRRKKRK